MRIRPYKHVIVALILALSIAGIGMRPAIAQQLMSIAVLVNDEVISKFDIQQRMLWLAQRTGRPKNQQEVNQLRARAQRQLEDELLVIQDVESAGITITDQMIDGRFERIAQGYDISTVNLIDRLRQSRIEVATVRREAEAYIARSIIVESRLRRQVTISEEDVDDKQAELSEEQGKYRYLVSEIILKKRGGETDGDFERRAGQIAGGARSPRDFAELAKRFSAGPTAKSGGVIDWVTPGQLGTALDNALSNMDDNTASPPIPTDDETLVILWLAQRAKVLDQDHSNTQIQLSQLLVPLGQKAPENDVRLAFDRANRIRAEIDDCVGMGKLASRHAGTQAADLGLLKIGELPEPLRSAVAELNAGEKSDPVRTAAGLNILMVCGRSRPAGQGPSRDRIRAELTNEKVGRRLDTYLKDLRRNATIERR